MGLAELFLGAENPFAKYVADNKQTVHGAFAGLGQGNSFSAGLGKAAIGAQRGSMLDDVTRADTKAEQERVAQINQTAAFLRAKGAEDLAAAVEGGMTTGADAFNQWYQQANAGPAAPIKVGAGETLLDPTTYQPVYQGAPDMQDQFGNEKDLYAQYAGSDPVKMYETVKSGYERVRQSAALQTGAGDMGLIYGYMKMLDPGSVVRESEFATAAQAGSYGEQIQGLVSRVINGERLPESVRQEFVQLAEGIYSETAGNLGNINDQFTTRAQNYGVDPTMFIRQPESYKPLQGIVTMPNGNTVKPL
jgi:hypothetical protein